MGVDGMVVARFALAAVVLGAVLIGVVAGGPAGAQSSRKVFLPAAARAGNLNPPLVFSTKLTGGTVSLTRTTGQTASRAATQIEATMTDLQLFNATFDNNRIDFEAELPPGAIDQIPPSGFALDIYGRFTDVSSGPAVTFSPFCADINTFRDLRVDGFRPNEPLTIRGYQTPAGEVVYFEGQYATDDQGSGLFQIGFGSGIPKSWGLNVTGNQSGLSAETTFDSISPGGNCATQPPVGLPNPLWSTRPDYGTNSTFHINVVRDGGVWNGQVQLWDPPNNQWGAFTSLPNTTISGNTIGVSADSGILGRPSSQPITSESGLAFGALTSYFAPGATTGVGKPAMLDRRKGPQGLMSLNQSEQPQAPASGIQIWMGCGPGISSNGFGSPPCPPQQARGAAQSTQPVFVGALAAATPPGSVLSTIYINRGGKTSLVPYGTYNPSGITFVFNTNPPAASPGVTSDNIPICGSATAWAEVNRLRGCADMQNYPGNYVANLQSKADPSRYTQYATGVPGQVAAWIPNTALAESQLGLYGLLPPNHHAYMPFVFRGTWGSSQVTVEYSHAPVGVPD